ncbi:RNA binding protein squid [Trichuris trichiura]|uniref:RNA binding protein squid n=1 Tax=Trichuris trichiura TaxID=36087 RepID=A0A077Z9E3_TRITR|nr:RNA binding protein squid [Trichuris trichiura]
MSQDFVPEEVVVDKDHYGGNSELSGMDYGTNNRPDGRKTKNEERKIFVGGITWDTENDDLIQYFSTFGTVSNVQIKYDHYTRRSRGFAFVEFQDAEACQKALAKKEVDIKGKKVEIKPAKSRENKKVFVGGLPSDFPEDKLRSHFEQFGKVDEIEWPFDKFQNRRKNFAFVVFDDDEAAGRAAAAPKQRFGERTCDVKIAVPQFMRPQKPAPTFSPGWATAQYDGYNYNQYPGYGYGYYDDYFSGSYDYNASGSAAANYGEYPAYAGMDNWNYGAAGAQTGQGTPVATGTQGTHVLPSGTACRGGRGYYGNTGYGYGGQ